MNDMNSIEFETFTEWRDRQERWRPEDAEEVDVDSLSSDSYNRVEAMAAAANPNFTGPQLNQNLNNNRGGHRQARSRSPHRGHPNNRRHHQHHHQHRHRSRSRSRSRSRHRHRSPGRYASGYPNTGHIVSVVDVSPKMLHLDKNGELQPRLIEEWVTHMRQVLRGQHHIYLLDWIDSFAKNYITLRFEQQWPQLVDTGDDWTKWSHEAIFSHMLKVWNKQKGAKTDISLESYYRDITPRAGHGEHGFISLEAWNAWTAKALSRYEEEVRGLGADLSTAEHKACIDTLLTHLPMTNDQTKYLHMKILEKGKPETIP